MKPQTIQVTKLAKDLGALDFSEQPLMSLPQVGFCLDSFTNQMLMKPSLAKSMLELVEEFQAQSMLDRGPELPGAGGDHPMEQADQQIDVMFKFKDYFTF